MQIHANEINIKKYLDKYRGVDLNRVYKFTDTIENYADACAHNHVNKIIYPFETLEHNLWGIEPGEVCLVISPPNIGKTALCQKFARDNAVKNQMMREKLLIWFSTETSEKHLLERELQRELDMYSYEVQEAFIQDREGMINISRNRLKQFENVRLVVGRVTIDQIPLYAQAISEEADMPIGGVMVDYAQRVRANAKNMFENMNEVADKIGEACIGLNVPFILTSQTSRDNARNRTLDEFSAKGSGELDNCGQIIITMQKLENEQMAIDNFDIQNKLLNQEIYVHQIEIRKKKRGKFLKEPLVIIQNSKTLELYEYEQYKKLLSVNSLF